MVIIANKYNKYNNNIKTGGSGRKGIIRRVPTVDELMDKIEIASNEERADKAKHEREIKQLREVRIQNKANRDKYLRGFVGVVSDDHQDRSAYVQGDIHPWFDARTPRYVPSRHGAIHARTSNNTVHNLIPRNVIKEDD